jgi:hypothetical protein
VLTAASEGSGLALVDLATATSAPAGGQLGAICRAHAHARPGRLALAVATRSPTGGSRGGVRDGSHVPDRDRV